MKVVLGIASFRTDQEVIRLCRRALEPEARTVFSNVVVVDSLGSGEIARFLARRDEDDYIQYYDAPRNLGAAGNLRHRLLWAEALGTDYLYAINADGHLDLEVVRRLVDFARGKACAAVYPLGRIAADCYDVTGIQRFPLRPIRRRERSIPSDRALAVSWSSSNGALYSLEPVRRGIVPPEELWHGWEDTAYGLLLARHGLPQWLLTSARIESRYEVRSIADGLGPGPYRLVSEKPPWLAYYTSRNLILIATRIVPSPIFLAGAITRTGLELTLTVAFRDQKARRLRFLLRGILDGIRGRTGMVVEPEAGSPRS